MSTDFWYVYTASKFSNISRFGTSIIKENWVKFNKSTLYTILIEKEKSGF